MLNSRKQDPVSKARSRDTIEGAASSSQLTGADFQAGAEVEVKINSVGFYGSWYEAKVLDRYSVTWYVKHKVLKYKVQYLNLLGDDGSKLLVEDVSAKNVRPRAPRRLSTPDASNEDEDPNIKMHDLVEASHNDGWWHGVVSGLRDPETGLYTVSFPNSREVFQFKLAEIRPQLAFVNGNWVPVLKEAQKKKTFKEGDKVEVYSLRDDYGPSYFPAQVEKVIHNSFYLVKYESPNARPNGDLTEILDPQYLRHAVDCMPRTNRFIADSHVEVFHKGGWSPGVVLCGPSGSNYAVTVETKGEPMTVHFNVSDMRLRLDWDGRRWSKWGTPSKVKKRKSANINKILTSGVSLTEESETTPDSVTSTSKKLKKERPKKVQELQSPSGNIFTPSCIRKDLESDDEASITKLLRLKSESMKNTSSSPRIRHAVRKISQSRKLLTELKDCHSKISTGRRSSTCKRNLKGWLTDKKHDKVNHNGRTTDEKQKDANLSNESCSDVPQPNTNGEKEAARVDTTSCQPQLSSNTNYTADHAGENAIGLLNSSEKQKDVNLSNENSSDVPEPNTNGEKAAARVDNTSCQQQLCSNTNDTADRAGENAIGVSSHDRAVGPIVDSESQCLLDTSEKQKDVNLSNESSSDVPQPNTNGEKASARVDTTSCQHQCLLKTQEISKGQLVDSQPLDSSATMEHPTVSQDKISNPKLSRPVSSVDQAAPLSLLENSVLTEPNPNSKFNKPTLAKHTPVKSVTSDIQLPFEKTSPLWEILETKLKVFNRIPQTPHFTKIESECKWKREGLAIAMMVTYDSLSESIQRLSFHTEVAVFEEKLSCLEYLEENGFIVDPIRSRLQRLLEVKKKYTEFVLRQVEKETTVAKKEKEHMRKHELVNDYEAQLENIEKSIAELKEKERATTEEKARLLGLIVEHERNISKLREELLSIIRSKELALEEFECLISEPLVAGGI